VIQAKKAYALQSDVSGLPYKMSSSILLPWLLECLWYWILLSSFHISV
jgi:hypothetical protein